MAEPIALVDPSPLALVARGVERGDIASKAYWRRGRANAAHGEPLRDEA